MYNPEGLCFILSQNDNSDFRYQTHLSSNPELKEVCQADIKQQEDDIANMVRLKKELIGVKRELAKTKTQIKDLEQKAIRLKKDAVDAPSTTSRPRKRARTIVVGISRL